MSMTKAEWFREKHPDPDEDKKYVEVADEAYDAGYEAAKQNTERPLHQSTEAIENAFKIYSMVIDPCPECEFRDKKNGKELENCQGCCFHYVSKFKMRKRK